MLKFWTVNERSSYNESMRYFQHLIFILACLGIMDSHAQGVQKKALALTTSGGVSLGSYQSGLLYFSNQIVKFGQKHELKLVTGASAGGINSLLSIFDVCSLKNSSPHESIFWRSWIPLGIDTLYLPEKVGRYNLLSRDQVEKILDIMENQWKKGLREDWKWY